MLPYFPCTCSCDRSAGCQPGHRVTILLSEELNAAGEPLVPMRTGNNFTDVWVLGAGAYPGVMQHEYEEFRYTDPPGN